MGVITAIAVCGPFLWLMGWLVTRHKGWAWLPLASTGVLFPVLSVWGPGIDRVLSSLPAVLAFVAVMGLALYAVSRAKALAVRVVAGTLLIPVAFLVTLSVGVTAFVGSVG